MIIFGNEKSTLEKSEELIEPTKRNKARDDVFFNCKQEHEDNFVARQYGDKQKVVSDFLEQCCNSNEIKYSTHAEVYDLIKKELGLTPQK